MPFNDRPGTLLIRHGCAREPKNVPRGRIDELFDCLCQVEEEAKSLAFCIRENSDFDVVSLATLSATGELKVPPPVLVGALANLDQDQLRKGFGRRRPSHPCGSVASRAL